MTNTTEQERSEKPIKREIFDALEGVKELNSVDYEFALEWFRKGVEAQLIRQHDSGQGEAVAEVRCRDGEVFGYIPKARHRIVIPLGTKLYAKPPLSQSAKDAYEKAARIVEDKVMLDNKGESKNWIAKYGDVNVVEAIRALITDTQEKG